MTIRYVDGTNGNDSYNGLSPVFTGGTNGPKLTLNGAEDTPVTPGDLVWVRPGTYRETLTVDVSGTFGNVIEYRGDYAGQIWANPNGSVVRVTGSNDDKSATRGNAITATTKPYRTFTGFSFDTTTSSIISNTTSVNWIIQKCFFHPGQTSISVSGAGQANCTIQDCIFLCNSPSTTISFSHSSTVDNTSHVVQNCIFIGAADNNISTNRIGGITIRNCIFLGTRTTAVRVLTAPSVGQTIPVNNCIFQGCNRAVEGTATGEIIEDFNTFFANGTNRTNVSTGANSLTYPALLDTRWFFQMIYAGAGPYSALQLSNPFDLSSQSQLINLTGTSPSSADMRGTTIQNTQREWGVLEYDSTLSIKARQAGLIGGGGMIIS